MRHAKKGAQLNRFTSWYKATVAGITRSLLFHQSIRTTKHRAYAARPLVERLITLAKKDTLEARRQAFKVLQDHKLVSLLFSEIGPRFKNRSSGFLRIVNLSPRRGDGALVCVMELTEIKKKEAKKAKKEAKKEEEAQHKPQAHIEEEKPKTETAVKEEKHPEARKPHKKFLGGIRNIFKKERDSL